MLPPTVWGKHIWTAIHLVALGFPAIPTDAERKQYESFFVSLGDVLPCCKCRDNYKIHLKELPVNFYLEDNKTLFAWTVEMHNIVNRSKGKKTWELEEAWQFYTSAKFDNVGQTKVIDNDKPLKITVFVLLLIIIILVFMYAKKR